MQVKGDYQPLIPAIWAIWELSKESFEEEGLWGAGGIVLDLLGYQAIARPWRRILEQVKI